MVAKSVNVKSQQNQIIEANVEKIISEANTLVIERETFEREELARSNKALYAILTKIYGLFNQAVESKSLKSVVVRMKDALNKRGVKVQKNSPALTVFVRYVFNSDRKRAYNYTSTLMAAIQANVEPSNLSSFIDSKNGVEECKKEFRKSEEAKVKEQALLTAAVEVAEGLSIMSSEHRVVLANETVDLSDGQQYAFIIARSLGDCEFELLRVVPRTTDGMYNLAVKELAKQLVERKEVAIADAKKQKVIEQVQKTAKTMTTRSAASMTVEELEAA